MSYRTVVNTVAICVLFVCSSAKAVSPPEAAPAADAKSPLVSAVTDWIAALEEDGDGHAAIKRFAANETAVKQMTELWSELKTAHKKFDYRRWIDGLDGGKGAKAVGDARTFHVGGHSYNHVHIEWARMGDDWRVSKVWLCR
jgi:hypothetical protein